MARSRACGVEHRAVGFIGSRCGIGLADIHGCVGEASGLHHVLTPLKICYAVSPAIVGAPGSAFRGCLNPSADFQ